MEVAAQSFTGPVLRSLLGGEDGSKAMCINGFVVAVAQPRMGIRLPPGIRLALQRGEEREEKCTEDWYQQGYLHVLAIQ